MNSFTSLYKVIVFIIRINMACFESESIITKIVS